MFLYRDAELSFHHSFSLHPLEEFPKSAAPHTHTQHELYFFVAGSADYLVEGRLYPLEPGSVMVMRRGEFHKVSVRSNSPYERIVLSFEESVLQPEGVAALLLAPLVNRPLGTGNLFTAREVRSAYIQECLKGVDRAPQATEQRRLAVQCALYTVLYELQSAFLRRGVKTAQEPGVQLLGSSIVEYINGHLFEELSLEILAEKFYLSKNHLNRLFKEASGSTVWEYIRLKRLLEAHWRIAGGAAATAAAADCGFHDYSAFYRAYKKHFGVAPGSQKGEQ